MSKGIFKLKSVSKRTKYCRQEEKQAQNDVQRAGCGGQRATHARNDVRRTSYDIQWHAACTEHILWAMRIPHTIFRASALKATFRVSDVAIIAFAAPAEKILLHGSFSPSHFDLFAKDQRRVRADPQVVWIHQFVNSPPLT